MGSIVGTLSLACTMKDSENLGDMTGAWFPDYNLCAVDGVVTSRDCEDVACAKENSCKGIHEVQALIIMLR